MSTNTEPSAVRPPLRALQQWFAGRLRGGTDRRRAVVNVTAIAPGPAASDFGPRTRLRVYEDAYVARLVEVLAGDYGATRARVGERAFARLARAYVATHPSRHPNLNRLGARFPAFLMRRAEVAPPVVALARLELALTRAFDAVEFVPLPAEALAALSPRRWHRAGLVVNPSVQIVRVPAAVADWFTAWRSGRPLAAPRRGLVEMCVTRIDDQVVRRELPRAAARALAGLKAGKSLAAALRGLPASAPVSAWFAQWRADGLFTAVS
jgi:hypothetical protein